MMRLKLALAQVRCEKGDWAGNLARSEEYIAQASNEGCDIIIFPEMGLSGYCDPAKFPDAVRTLDAPWVLAFVGLTARYGIVASGGFIESNPTGKPFITQVLAQDGQIRGVYRKIYVVEEEADWFTPGEETCVINLRLPEGDLTCGLAVCTDSDRADLFSDMRQQGARIIFHSSAPGLYHRRKDDADWQAGYDWYKSHLSERLPLYARDNQLFIAVATQTGATIDEDFPGGSYIFGPDGSCLACTLGYEETLLVHELDFPEW